MSEEYDKIMKMLDDHEKGQTMQQDGDRKQRDKALGLVVHYVGGVIGISVISLIIGLISPTGFSLQVVISIAETISIIVAILGLIFIAVTQAAASAQLGGEMMRRAWTSQAHNENAMKDYLNTVDWGGWIVGYFWAGVTFIILNYYEVFGV